MLFFLLLFSTASYAAPILSDAIFQGRPVSASGQTWKSSVGLSLETSDGSWYRCSGVFIAADVILTAAHCAEGVKNNNKIYIYLYKENNTEAITLAPAEGEFRMLANPHYHMTSSYDPGTDDIAVLVLKNQEIPYDFSPTEFQTEAQRSASEVGQVATVVGAGLTEKKVISDRLYFAQGTIENYLEGDVEEIHFPARKGVCGGDSGGPVFVSQAGQLYLSAITTATSPNLADTCGDVLYANAITLPRYEWIQAASAKLRRALSEPVPLAK